MTANTPELPPLPEPHLSADETDDGLRHYTSDQMRAYALQERAEERERWVKVCEAIAQTGPEAAYTAGRCLAAIRGA